MGSTDSALKCRGTDQNHPHVYGEHSPYKSSSESSSESSPCIWGAHKFKKKSFKNLRIIPMYMGSTTCWYYCWCSSFGIIPMYMGSTRKRCSYKRNTVESSPCIWGALELGDADKIGEGIIPMYMGSTNYSTYRVRRHRESSPCIWGAR